MSYSFPKIYSLFQLNNVPNGGATVFTDAEVTVWPEQGSMAFWYNLHRNGTGTIDTIHAACPVLIGNKWGKIINLHRLQLH